MAESQVNQILRKHLGSQCCPSLHGDVTGDSWGDPASPGSSQAEQTAGAPSSAPRAGSRRLAESAGRNSPGLGIAPSGRSRLRGNFLETAAPGWVGGGHHLARSGVRGSRVPADGAGHTSLRLAPMLQPCPQHRGRPVSGRRTCAQVPVTGSGGLWPGCPSLTRGR